MTEQLEERPVHVDDLAIIVREDHRVARIPERRLEESGPAVRGHGTILTRSEPAFQHRGGYSPAFSS